MSRHRIVIWFTGRPMGESVASMLHRAAEVVAGKPSVFEGGTRVDATAAACDAIIQSFRECEFSGELKWEVATRGNLVGRVWWRIHSSPPGAQGTIEVIVTFRPKRPVKGFSFDSARELAVFALELASGVGAETLVVEPLSLSDMLLAARSLDPKENEGLPVADWIFGLSTTFVTKALEEQLGMFESASQRNFKVWILSEVPIHERSEAGLRMLKTVHAALLQIQAPYPFSGPHLGLVAPLTK